MADGALGFAPTAHAELAEPAARLRLRRRGSRRFPHDAARPSNSSSATRVRSSGAGRDPHTRSRRVRASDDGYRVSTDRGDWRCRTVVAGGRGVQYRERARVRGGAAARDRDAHADGVSQSGSAPGGRRACRRRIGDRHPARRGDPRRGPAGDARRRRARARAADLSRQGHPVVDGRRRRAGRAL